MRTFVAVEIINENILNSIKKIQTELRIDAKPVKVENIHFTLMFLGEISESVNEKIQTCLDLIKFESFEIKFEGVGAFPKPKLPRVIWIGTDRQSGEKLKELAKKVEEVLLPLGFKSDKPFKPHVTIFRIKNKVRDVSEELAKYQNKEFGSQNVKEIKLKKSILTPNGPNYSDLKVIEASR